jgi:hypothetical protein
VDVIPGGREKPACHCKKWLNEQYELGLTCFSVWKRWKITAQDTATAKDNEGSKGWLKKMEAL